MTREEINQYFTQANRLGVDKQKATDFLKKRLAEEKQKVAPKGMKPVPQVSDIPPQIDDLDYESFNKLGDKGKEAYKRIKGEAPVKPMGGIGGLIQRPETFTESQVVKDLGETFTGMGETVQKLQEEPTTAEGIFKGGASLSAGGVEMGFNIINATLKPFLELAGEGYKSSYNKLPDEAKKSVVGTIKALANTDAADVYNEFVIQPTKESYEALMTWSDENPEESKLASDMLTTLSVLPIEEVLAKHVNKFGDASVSLFKDLLPKAEKSALKLESNIETRLQKQIEKESFDFYKPEYSKTKSTQAFLESGGDNSYLEGIEINPMKAHQDALKAMKDIVKPTKKGVIEGVEKLEKEIGGIREALITKLKTIKSDPQIFNFQTKLKDLTKGKVNSLTRRGTKLQKEYQEISSALKRFMGDAQNPGELLEGRQAFDAWARKEYPSVYKKMDDAFSPGETVQAEAIKDMRSLANQHIEDVLGEDAGKVFRDSLKLQHDLIMGKTMVAEKAAILKGQSTYKSIVNFAKAHPLFLGGAGLALLGTPIVPALLGGYVTVKGLHKVITAKEVKKVMIDMLRKLNKTNAPKKTTDQLRDIIDKLPAESVEDINLKDAKAKAQAMVDNLRGIEGEYEVINGNTIMRKGEGSSSGNLTSGAETGRIQRKKFLNNRKQEAYDEFIRQRELEEAGKTAGEGFSVDIRPTKIEDIILTKAEKDFIQETTNKEEAYRVFLELEEAKLAGQTAGDGFTVDIKQEDVVSLLKEQEDAILKIAKNQEEAALMAKKLIQAQNEGKALGVDFVMEDLINTPINKFTNKTKLKSGKETADAVKAYRKRNKLKLSGGKGNTAQINANKPKTPKELAEEILDPFKKTSFSQPLDKPSNK